MSYNTDLHFSLPFKVVPPRFEHDLVLLATLIRGGGGSQAQDHDQAISAKISTVSQVLLQLVVA